MIFHRLNSGGSKLNNQEIRNCIYSGLYNNLLKELDANDMWMKINKMERPSGYRFTKQEIILRFFALHDCYESYGGRLAKFLNDYMDEYRNASSEFLNRKRELFNRTVKIIYSSIFAGRIPPKLSISILEATLVGVSHNLDYLEKQPNERIQEIYTKLRHEDEFSEENLKEGLASKEKVKKRIKTAIKVFSGN